LKGIAVVRLTMIALVKYFGKLITILLGFMVMSRMAKKIASSTFESFTKLKIMAIYDVIV